MDRIFLALKQFWRDKTGIAAIEFSLVFMVFVGMTFFIFEISRYMFISSAMDLTLMESARIASIQSKKDVDYAKVFSDTVSEQSNLWSAFLDGDNYRVDVNYCSDVAEAIRGRCSDKNALKKVIAIYKVSYDYQPLLLSSAVPGTDNLIRTLKSSLSRQLVYVQEYEREGIFKDD